VYSNFNKGLNDSSSLDALKDEELKEAQNIDLMIRGGYTQRKGCTEALLNPVDVNDPVGTLIHYPDNPLIVSNKVVYDWDGVKIFDNLAKSDVSWEFFTNKKVYVVDGAGYYVYDGASWEVVTPGTDSDLTPIQRCTFIIQRGQRMFAFGDPEYPNFIYFSEPGAPEIFLAASIIQAVTDDKDVLTAAALYNQGLVVFKSDSVFFWSGWDPSTDVTFDPLNVHDGTVAPGSIVKADDYLLFLGQDAIIAMATTNKDVVSTMRVSPNITKTIESLTNTDKAVGVFYKGSYYLACCDDNTGVNNLVLKGHVSMAYNEFDNVSSWERVFPWTIYRGWKVSQWYKGADGYLHFGSAVDGMVYKAFDGYDDNGVAIESYVSHRIKLDEKYSYSPKKLKKLMIMAKQIEATSCSIDVEINLENYKIYKRISLDESGKWDASDWDEVDWDWVDVITKEILVNHRCNRVEIRVKHVNLSEDMGIYGFAALFRPKKPKGVRTGVDDIPAF